MILPCPLCQARFNVPDDKVSGPGTKIQCPKCKFTFVIKAPGESATAVTAEQTKTDTDPAIDPALAQAVVAEAIQHQSSAASGASAAQTEIEDTTGSVGLQASTQDTKSTIRIRPPQDTVETMPVGLAQVADPSDSTPTVPMSTSPSAQAEFHEKPDESLESDDDATPTEVDIDPELAKKVREEAMANAPEVVADFVLEEVEPEAHTLTPEELAKIPDAEIVDADDLAQLAETAGETEVKENLSPKVEAEAAGQWPSIIVDDPLLENSRPAGLDSGETRSDSNEPTGTRPTDAAASQDTGPASAGHESNGSRQALQAAQQRAQAAQQAVDQLMNAQNVAQAQQQLVAAQAELQRAMLQLQSAQQAYLAAQQRLTETTRATSEMPGGSQTQSSAFPGATQTDAPVAPHDDMGILDDDLDSNAKIPRGHHGLIFSTAAAAVIVAAVGAYFLLRTPSKDVPRAQAVQSSVDSETWKGIGVDIQSVRVLPRPSSPSLVVVNAVLRNRTSKYRYENPYVFGILTSGGAKLDEGVAPCGAQLGTSLILRLVKAKGRQGYYDRLRKFVLASDETQKVKPGGSLPCQILFFDSTGHQSARGLKVDLRIDKNKTIAAPAK